MERTGKVQTTRNNPRLAAEKERQINYEIDKAYLEYIYKRDSLIIEYNKQ